MKRKIWKTQEEQQDMNKIKFILADDEEEQVFSIQSILRKIKKQMTKKS